MLVPTTIISKKEKDLLIKFYNSKCDLKKISRGKNSETMRKKIYRIKSEVIAWNNIQNGIVGTKKIIGAKLNDNIKNFTKSFKQNFMNNSLERMKRYFLECDIPTKFPRFDISKIVKYSINLIDSNVYKLWVYYLDSAKNPLGFIAEFTITASNEIRLLKFPELPDAIYGIELSKLPKHVLEAIKPDSKGDKRFSDEELMEYLKSESIKLEEVFVQEDEK